MGGAAPKRKEIPIQLAKEETNTLDKYGDPRPPLIVGVGHQTQLLKTRIHQWRIVSTKELERLYPVSPEAAKPPWSSVNNCTKFRIDNTWVP